MSEITDRILEVIHDSDKIAIGRHFRPDGDAIGSTHGLAGILRLSFPDKDVRLVNLDSSDSVSFLGKEDDKPSDLSSYTAIIIDTATKDRVSDPDIFKCNKIIKIDHHVETETFGDISWVLPSCPSASEMIASLWYENQDKLKIDLFAATCLYTGMVTDTGNFKYGNVNSTTMMLAGKLLDFGIDIQTLHANLDLQDYNFYKFQSFIFDSMNVSPNGVAWLYLDQKTQQKFNLTREQASESVNFMNAIKGSLIWMAFIENPDNAIRVRVRSRFVEINKLAEKYRGGGHAMASGATVFNMQELKNLVSDADKLLKEYKATHSDWL